MAKMLVSPANFILLDEPTNHLDMRAKDVLLDAIRDFSGTVLFVSHDRYFIDGLATRVFEVEDKRVHIYPGNYEDYMFRKAGGTEKMAAEVASNPHIDHATGMFKALAPRVVPDTPKVEVVPEPVAVKSNVKRLNPIKLKQLESRVAELEEVLPDLEARILIAEQQQGNYTTAEAAQSVAAELDRLRADHAARTAEWEELAMQLEEQMTA
jgi:ATP-binding cassette subfamily F protein 3